MTTQLTEKDTGKAGVFSSFNHLPGALYRVLDPPSLIITVCGFGKPRYEFTERALSHLQRTCSLLELA